MGIKPIPTKSPSNLPPRGSVKWKVGNGNVKYKMAMVEGKKWKELRSI